jgi:hypothetical protein
MNQLTRIADCGFGNFHHLGHNSHVKKSEFNNPNPAKGELSLAKSEIIIIAA